MARSKAKEHRPKLSPVLSATLVPLALLPSRELAPPEALPAAVHGVDRLRLDATDRAEHRSTEAATQREHSSGKTTSLRCSIRSCRSLPS